MARLPFQRYYKNWLPSNSKAQVLLPICPKWLGVSGVEHDRTMTVYIAVNVGSTILRTSSSVVCFAEHPTKLFSRFALYICSPLYHLSSISCPWVSVFLGCWIEDPEALCLHFGTTYIYSELLAVFKVHCRVFSSWNKRCRTKVLRIARHNCTICKSGGSRNYPLSGQPIASKRSKVSQRPVSRLSDFASNRP